MARLALWLPRRWLATRRRRRLLFLALAAPGFFAVFGTPLHRNFFVAMAGFVLFGAAIVFRRRTEPLFDQLASEGADPKTDPKTEETRRA